jgi:hypothetical protein
MFANSARLALFARLAKLAMLALLAKLAKLAILDELTEMLERYPPSPMKKLATAALPKFALSVTLRLPIKVLATTLLFPA